MKNHKGSYLRFILMILTSLAVMFILKYFNTYSLDHIHWSETRFYMAFMMGASMAIIMLSFMLNMYPNKLLNLAIYGSSILVFALSLSLVRSQSTVEDISWMRAMIPHHSIAILTSERASIKDVRVRDVADKIIRAQRKEIKEMEWLISDIKRNGPITEESQKETRPLPDFKGTLGLNYE